MPQWDPAAFALVIGAVAGGIVAIITALGAAVVAAVSAYRANAKADVTAAAIAANTKLTADTHAQGTEIKSLVNGAQTRLLEQLEASKKALDLMHSENRSLHSLIAKLLPEEAAAAGPTAAASLREIETNTAETAKNTAP